MKSPEKDRQATIVTLAHPANVETMERLLMKLNVLKAEALSMINVNFREKVQLEEQVKDNEIKIHFRRGYMQALEEVGKVIEDLKKGEQIEIMESMEVMAEKRVASDKLIVGEAIGEPSGDSKGKVKVAPGVFNPEVPA